VNGIFAEFLKLNSMEGQKGEFPFFVF